MSTAKEAPRRLSREEAHDHPRLPIQPDPGEYFCPFCNCRVTVGKSGREYGHAPYYHPNGPCRRRPKDLLSDLGLERLTEKGVYDVDSNE